MAVDLEAPSVELLELAPLERSAHLAQGGAELRPEHREVRLDAKLGSLDIAERHVSHTQLVCDLVRVAVRRRRCAGNDEPAQRLAKLQL